MNKNKIVIAAAVLITAGAVLTFGNSQLFQGRIFGKPNVPPSFNQSTNMAQNMLPKITPQFCETNGGHNFQNGTSLTFGWEDESTTLVKLIKTDKGKDLKYQATLEINGVKKGPVKVGDTIKSNDETGTIELRITEIKDQIIVREDPTILLPKTLLPKMKFDIKRCYSKK